MDRFAWAASIVDARPGERLLELGCGHGLLIDEVCRRPGVGPIVALDRSATMTAAAAKRNQEHLDRVELITATLADADLGDRVFDKVYSFNVSLFWTPSASGLARVAELLAPSGTLYVFHQAPGSGKNPIVERRCRAPDAGMIALLGISNAA